MRDDSRGDVTFSSGGKTTRAWEQTVRGYLERYPTRSEMGRLSFGKLEITPLGEEAALVLGEWKLERGTGDTPVAHGESVKREFFTGVPQDRWGGG